MLSVTRILNPGLRSCIEAQILKLMIGVKKDQEKLQPERHQLIIQELLRDEDNKYCVDCDAKGSFIRSRNKLRSPVGVVEHRCIFVHSVCWNPS